MSKFDFSHLDPNDGFKVACIAAGSEYSVHVYLRVGGEVSSPFAVTQEESAELCNHDRPGQHLRAAQLARAICQYFNAGGDWPEFEHMVQEIRKVIPGGFVFSGWNVIDVYNDVEGYYNYCFLNDTQTKGVRWVENITVDIMSAVELMEEYVQPIEESFRSIHGALHPDDHAETRGHAGEAPMLRYDGPQG